MTISESSRLINKQSNIIKEIILQKLNQILGPNIDNLPEMLLKEYDNGTKHVAINKIGKQIKLALTNLYFIVEVNTVDSFQGREKDTIIISWVRANKSQNWSIGFLNDYRRMNVAITRAINFLWVVGHAPTLTQNDHWRNLIFHWYSKNLVKWFITKDETNIENILEDQNDRVTESLAVFFESMSK